MLNDSEIRRCDPGTGVHRDAGSALIMAVLVSVVVFVLGAMWMTIASHESSASNNDRRRQHAIDAAMAGLVHANSELSGNDEYAPADKVVGFAGGTAEFEVTVEDVVGAPLRRLVTSTGYAPSKADAARTVRTVQQEVELEAVGFTYGVFSERQFVIGPASTVIGDVYSGWDIEIGNHPQDYFGNISTSGNMVTGRNQRVTGSLHADGSIYIHAKTVVNGSAYAGDDIDTDGNSGELDVAQAGGTANCDLVRDGGSCLSDSPPPEVPVQTLPSFVYPLSYSSVTGAAFVTQVRTDGESSGIVYVDGDVTFDKNDSISLSDDLTIVATGSITLPRRISQTTNGQVLQLTVISTGEGAITLPNNFTIPVTVRTLIYTQGPFTTNNSTAFTGVLYAGSVATHANLSITYAPVSSSGFDWTALGSGERTIRNISTREVANTP